MNKDNNSHNCMLAHEAFRLLNRILGTETGGIEGPRVLLSSKDLKNGAVEITWRNPETGGLSDRSYHYTDTKPHTDIYSFKNGQFRINGENPFKDMCSWFADSKKEVRVFCQKYGFNP